MGGSVRTGKMIEGVIKAEALKRTKLRLEPYMSLQP